MTSSDGNENSGKQMMDYCVIDLPAITNFKQVKIEEETKIKIHEHEISNEKTVVSPVLEIKVYFSDREPLHEEKNIEQQNLPVDDEETKKEEEDYSVLDVCTVEDLVQVIANLEVKKQKIEKMIIKVPVSPSPIVDTKTTTVEEEVEDEAEEKYDDDDDENDEEKEDGEEDEVEEEEQDEDEKEVVEVEEEEEIKRNTSWVFELEDGWETEFIIEDPQEYTRLLQVFDKEKRERMLYYHRIATESKGFDIDCSAPPGYCWATPIDLNDPSQLELVNRMAKIAVEYYNTKYKEKGKMIEFLRVHHANIHKSCAYVYFITLLAKDLMKDGDEEKTYQTNIIHWNWWNKYGSGESDTTRVEGFRLKTNPNSQCV